MFGIRGILYLPILSIVSPRERRRTSWKIFSKILSSSSGRSPRFSISPPRCLEQPIVSGFIWFRSCHSQYSLDIYSQAWMLALKMKLVRKRNFIFVVLKMHEIQENPLEKKSIRELPNEILLTIFSYLQTSDVKYSISNVCIQWSLLARDKKLWKDLSFKTTNKSTKVFGVGSWFSTLTFLKNTPELQNVTISQGHSEEEVAELLKSLNDFCPNLKHIAFDLDIAVIVKYLRGLHFLLENVESLTLLLGPGPSQVNVFKKLTEFKKLRKIAFFGTNPESKGFRNFLRDSPSLQHVNVVGVDFSKVNFMSLWQAKDRFITLEMKIDQLDENCLKLFTMFPNLNNLILTDGNSSPKKLCKIGKLKCLSKLYLQEAASSPVLTPSALTEFFHNGCFLKLKILKLHKSRLDDEGAAEIRRNCLNLLYLEVMTYPRSISSLSEKALLHFLHCKSLRHFEILFDNSQEADWVYRRIRYVHHDCEVDGICPFGLEKLLECWDELHIPID